MDEGGKTGATRRRCRGRSGHGHATPMRELQVEEDVEEEEKASREGRREGGKLFSASPLARVLLLLLLVGCFSSASKADDDDDVRAGKGDGLSQQSEAVAVVFQKGVGETTQWSMISSKIQTLTRTASAKLRIVL